MDASALRRRIEEARVARLATSGEDGRPHAVPIVFTVEDGTLYFAVDAKPKRTTELKRLRNIAANPRVSVLVDHYEDDWTRLWWIRIDGTARLVDGAVAGHAVELLARKYPQYRDTPPPGPVVAVAIQRTTSWSAVEGA